MSGKTRYLSYIIDALIGIMRNLFSVLFLFMLCEHFCYAQDTICIPLTDLGAHTYKSYIGGLYPGGKNQMPYSHDSAGRALAKAIVPLKKDGTPDPFNGIIVLLSIGMSNTTMEFSTFKQIADTDHSKNPKLTIVDGAQGGQTASIISNPAASFWTTVDKRLDSNGVSPQQVQIAWIKEADSNPTKAFPVHAQTLSTELETITRILKSRYPNMKLAFLSSRIYGGYATSPLNPEPYAYESGFSVQWLIEKQMSGDTSLAYTGNKIRSPWLAWGPYLWADGLTPRSDGLIWEKVDFVTSDYTHPSATGCQKVAKMLLAFFKSDPTTSIWFLKQASSVQTTHGLIPTDFTLLQNFPNPFNSSTTIRYAIPAISRVRLQIFNVLGQLLSEPVNSEQSEGYQSVQWNAAVSSGEYFYKIEAIEVNKPSNRFVSTKKMVLLK
jgi:hypothetical protein